MSYGEAVKRRADDGGPPLVVGVKRPEGSGSTALHAWTNAEEARARRKVDLTVLPLLFAGFLVFQLDRMNVASALTDGFGVDVGIDQATVNLGNQLMYLGTVLLEIPSNLMLQKLGPARWLPAQVLAFGALATLQVLVKDRAGFLASRAFLGLAEAGYIPGSMYTIQSWYKRRELARRLAIFFFGMFGGNALGPLLASAILKLRGACGLRGWQWLFLIEGLATMLLSLLLFMLLPASPDDPRPLLTPGLVRISGADQALLQQRLVQDDSEQRAGAQSATISLAVVWKTVKQYRRWPHFVSTFAVFSTWSPLTTYTPTIMMHLGFDRIVANALAAVGASLALAVVMAFACVSDATDRRGATVVAAQTCYLVTLVAARSLHRHVGRWARWALWTAVNAFAVGYHPVHNTWLQLDCREPGERSVSIAMWVMSAISGLMVGTQYFRADDLPFYDRGLITMVAMVSLGIAFALLQMAIYNVHNRRLERGQARCGEERAGPLVHPHVL